jgi:hypothetical protein
MSSLDEGITSQGAVNKSYDKFGKRIYVATPVQDKSKQDKDYAVRSGNPPMPKNSEQDRTLSDIGVK